MTKPSHRSESGEQREERRRCRKAGLYALRLMDEAAAAQMRANPEPVTAIDVHDRKQRGQIQRSVEQAWQREGCLPVDVGVVSLAEDPRSLERGIDGILDDERLWRVDLVVAHREGVAPGKTRDANRCAEAGRRLTRIPLERDRVLCPIGVGEESICKLARLVEIQRTIGREVERRRPIEPRGDSYRRRADAELREGAVLGFAPRVLSIAGPEVQ